LILTLNIYDYKAKRARIRGYSKLNKCRLITLLNRNGVKWKNRKLYLGPISARRRRPIL
jgi:hypothetical protein